MTGSLSMEILLHKLKSILPGRRQENIDCNPIAIGLILPVLLSSRLFFSVAFNRVSFYFVFTFRSLVSSFYDFLTADNRESKLLSVIHYYSGLPPPYYQNF